MNKSKNPVKGLTMTLYHGDPEFQARLEQQASLHQQLMKLTGGKTVPAAIAMQLGYAAGIEAAIKEVKAYNDEYWGFNVSRLLRRLRTLKKKGKKI